MADFTQAGDSPIFLGHATSTRDRSLSQVDVTVLDRANLPHDWRDGLVIRLDTPATTAATAAVSVDYSGFRWAYGGDWASRLRLWQLPECALTTPEKSGCSARPLDSANDATSARVSADVKILPGAESARHGRLADDGAVPANLGGTLVALAAGSAGSAGDFGATSLSPSAAASPGLTACGCHRE
jgi:hypothetical protein